MKIAHISDIHWLDTTGTTPLDFLNHAIKSQHCSHLIVSGDLSNLSLPAEFRGVKAMLNEFFSDLEMSIVPGNHDYYTQESLRARRFERMIYPLRPGHIDVSLEKSWPFVNLVGNVAIIGLCSAYPRPWFVAGGRIGEAQLALLDAALHHREVRFRTKIVVLHHHLYQVDMSPGESLRNLADRRDLLDVCLKNSVTMIAHGHSHGYELRRVGGIILSEPGSCSVARYKTPEKAGKFNIYDFDKKGNLREIQTWRYDDGAYALWRSCPPSEIPEIPFGMPL